MMSSPQGPSAQQSTHPARLMGIIPAHVDGIRARSFR
jgi:hypothetical protein